MRHILYILMFFSFTSLYAKDGGSVYTRYGLGDIRYYQSGRSVGLGGIGAAIFSNYSINRLNPAGWTTLNRTRYEISGMFEGILNIMVPNSDVLHGIMRKIQGIKGILKTTRYDSV